MQENFVHFVASSAPAGQSVGGGGYYREGFPVKSAGHTKHEYTTGYAHEEILKHFIWLPQGLQTRQTI